MFLENEVNAHMDTTQIFGTEKISKVLFKLAPPVMLAQLIQALYNIVDSLFVGKYSGTGLTALSIIYPIQLLMIALAVGTGVGINTVMAAKLGIGKKEEADEFAGVGTPLAVGIWFTFALICWFIMPAYARISTNSQAIIRDVIVYGRIVCVFSIGLFLESILTKVLQANGNMKTPMYAQIAGAVTTSLIFPIFFQAVGSALKSSLLTLIRTVVLFVPLGFLFSRFGLTFFWLTFPVTEILTSLAGVIFYRQFLDHPYMKTTTKELHT